MKTAMQPVPPPGWKNFMEEDKAVQKEKAQDWDSGVLGFCSDMNSCCLGLFCPCLLYGMAKGLVGEDKWGNTAAFALALPLPCTLVFFFRENLRVQYKLSTNIVLDFLLSAICCPCVLCQIYRQVKERPIVHSTTGSAEFSSGVFDCMDDPASCCLVAACPCLAFGIVRRKMGQSRECSAVLWCPPFAVLPCVHGCVNRGVLRAKYGMAQDAKVDAALWASVPCLALCQELRHLKKFPYAANVKGKNNQRVAVAID